MEDSPDAVPLTTHRIGNWSALLLAAAFAPNWSVGLDQYAAILVVICLLLSFCLYSVRGIFAANLEVGTDSTHSVAVYNAGAFISLISNAQVRCNPFCFSTVETCSQCNSPMCALCWYAGYSGHRLARLLWCFSAVADERHPLAGLSGR